MSERARRNFTIEDMADGEILARERLLDDGRHAYTFGWQGGPLTRIIRGVWGRLNPDCGERRGHLARIGPFRLALVDDNPYLPYEIWLQRPAERPAQGVAG